METPAPNDAASPTLEAEGGGVRPALWLLGSAMAVGAVLRIHLALTDDGIYWPDEIYQSLEQAHRLAFGYGLIPWEFVEGARSWTFPGLLGGILALLSRIGLGEPSGYLPAMRVLFCLLGVATGWAVYRLARAQGAAPLSSAAAGAAFLLVAPTVYFAPRAMSETASALPAALGLALALRREASLRAVAVGASLLGFAVLLRLQDAAFCVGLLAVLLARKQLRAAGVATAALAGWALAYGLIDALTWGHWFHSAVVYLRFNLVEGRGAQWGTAGWGYYAAVVFSSMPSAALALLLLGAAGAKRAAALLAVAAAFLAIHVAVPHKEYRFLLPVLPLLFAVAASGIDAAARFAPRPVIAAALVLAALGSTATYRSLTFGDLGQYADSRPGSSAFDDFGPVNRLLLRAHDAPELCGLKVESVHLAWTGGETYLHRRAPLYPHTGPPRESHLFNYAITLPAWAREGQIVATEGGQALVRFPWQCAADPGYAWRLP